MNGPSERRFTIRRNEQTEETVLGYEGVQGKKSAYSDNSLAFVHDFNDGGWADISIYWFLGKELLWSCVRQVQQIRCHGR